MLNPLDLLKILKEKQLLSGPNLIEAEKSLKQSGFNFEDWLLHNHTLDREALTKIKADFFHLAYINLAEVAIRDNHLHFIPRDICKTYSMVCFFKDDRVAKIGLMEFDIRAMEAANFLVAGQSLRAEFYLISSDSFVRAFRGFEKMEDEISTALQVKAQERGEELIEVQQDVTNVFKEEDANSAPIAKIVSVIIRHAIESRASDIHIEPYSNESRVRYRIDGILHNSLTLPKSIHTSVVARIKVLAKLKLDETRIPQDGRIRLTVDSHEIDLRVSILPLANSEKAMLRILDQSKGLQSLKELGFNNFCYDLIVSGFAKTSGIILVTGPTGSGKTTTLYAFLTSLNKEGVNISTIEDPIEYQIKGINQSQIKPELGFTFATGLRSLLRQDPNVIMVGEVRDQETAELAIQAGLTGHLVVSTLHTNDALGTIFRLLDMAVEPFLLASVLRVIVAQRLLRRLCPHCKKEIILPAAIIAKMIAELQQAPLDLVMKELPGMKTLDDIKAMKFYEPVGCAKCSSTGYYERTVIGEALVINDYMKEIIISHRQDLNLEIIKKGQPFISLKQDGIIKVIKGITDLQEILRVVEIESL